MHSSQSPRWGRNSASYLSRFSPAEQGGGSGQLRHIAMPEMADGGAAHGTGLKLVRQIAEAHGGTVQFRQGASHGLEVSISLPTSNA